MKRPQSFIYSSCLFWGFILLLDAQIQKDPHIETSGINNNVIWDSVLGRNYFLQSSSNLTDWQYLPYLEQGDNTQMSFELPSSPKETFTRLQYVDLSTTDPKTADFDNDGITNWNEIKIGGSQTEPFSFSSAGNGISDYHHDSDGNTLKDGWELKYKDSVGLISASGDEDLDGLPNSRESILDSNPDDNDTDNDGLFDKVEDDNGTNLFLNEF